MAGIVKKATYVDRARAYMSRTALHGKRYFLGYWETEAQAVNMANRFRQMNEGKPEAECIESANMAKQMARNAAAELRDLNSRNNKGGPRRTLKDDIFDLNGRIKSLEGRIERMEQARG